MDDREIRNRIHQILSENPACIVTSAWLDFKCNGMKCEVYYNVHTINNNFDIFMVAYSKDETFRGENIYIDFDHLEVEIKKYLDAFLKELE